MNPTDTPKPIPSPLKVQVTGGGQFDFTVHVELDGEERPRMRATSLTIHTRPGGEPLTARAMQRACVGEVIRLAIAASSAHLPVAKPRPPGRPKTVTTEELRMAAEVYRQAQRDGRPTTAAVAAALSVSPATALKRVQHARHAGLLPPTGGTTRPKL